MNTTASVEQEPELETQTFVLEVKVTRGAGCRPLTEHSVVSWLREVQVIEDGVVPEHDSYTLGLVSIRPGAK